MISRPQSIRHKLSAMIVLTGGVVLGVACGTFLVYEVMTARQTMASELSTISRVVASNSTAALAFENRDDAADVLSALTADTRIVSAGLYDRSGRLFARYPPGADASPDPASPGQDGYRFMPGRLVVQAPVAQGNRRLGTLVITSDLSAMYARLTVYAGLAALAVGLSALVAFPLSSRLQRDISGPLLALAGTAKAVSEKRDYSVRVERSGDDEIGRLADAFNGMLARVEAHEASLRQRHDRILDAVGEGIYGQDENGRLSFKNPAAASLLGWEHEDVIGQHAHALIHHSRPDGSPYPVEECPIHATIRDGATRRVDNEVFWRRDGTPMPVAYTTAPLRDDDGRSIGVVVAFRDMTEARQATAAIERLNAQLRQRAAQLEEANKELESFSYSVSHDLRAPLRHVHGYVELLQRSLDGQLPEKARRYLQTISDASIEMGHLVDDLLAFSRMGRSTMAESRVDLEAVVRSAVRSQEPAIRDRRIDWVIGPLPPVVGDAAMLKLALGNLIGNAVKYSRGRDPARIEIGTSGDEDGRVILFVRDNGAGFDMRYASKLFGVFQRLHRSEQFEGTGIGLATVRRIVARHGGRVWGEGAIDRGATFYCTLKRAAVQTPTARAAARRS